MKICIKCNSNNSKQWYLILNEIHCKKCYDKFQYNKYKTKNASKKFSNERAFTFAKMCALKREKEWLLSFEEYINLINKSCYYCNNKLSEPVRRGIGLDRINNDIGYQINNVLVCCKICNSIRNNFLSVEEVKIAVQAIINYREGKLL
jgi:hypothetical protein